MPKKCPCVICHLRRRDALYEKLERVGKDLAWALAGVLALVVSFFLFAER